MRMNKLGRTDIEITELCLGSMTWGTQNSESEGHAQIDMALGYGVNIIDTAEMYPVNPLSAETQGDTERVIGTWNAKNKARRGDYILATKAAGAGYARIRDGADISRETLAQSVASSLKSLQTDYIDIYQLHWPNRGSYMFRKNWKFDPTVQDTDKTLAHMLEVLQTMDEMIKAGKIRHFALSNESAWGLSQWLRLSEEHNLPRVVSVQNEYSLLCRLFDTDMAELCHHEDVGLLAYSPLAAGLLSGKYQNNQTPAGSRRSHVANLGGRLAGDSLPAVDAYLEIAQKHGLNPCHMALAWCSARPFTASTIFGATSLEQLEIALHSSEVVLSDEVLADIQTAHKQHPMPY